VSYAQGCRVAREGSNSKISVWSNGTRTKTSNDEQMLSPEDSNFIRKRCGGLEPNRLENIAQEGTILLRISFR